MKASLSGLLLVLGLAAWVPGLRAQNGVVIGTVVAAGSFEPVPGASVSVVGTSREVVTDAAGRFRIDGLAGTTVTLDVKRIGFSPASQPIDVGRPSVRIELAQRASVLDAIVVTGTAGETKARAVGNAVTRTLVAEVLKAAPVIDVPQVLAARVPGVVITPTQGVAGAGAVTRIRGSSSLFLPNEPLLYVDGVRVDNNTRAGPYIRGGSQVSRISDIDPEEIENIEVIKGPAAGTLYGTEASRGVIQIFTRRGIEGPPRFGITVRQGANWFRNPEGRLNWAFRRNAAGGLDSINLYQIEADAGRPIFRTGRPQGYGLNVSGGTPIVRYFASAGFDRNEGVVSYDWRNRLSTRANLTLLPSDKFTIETSLGFVRNRMRLGQMTSVAEIGWDAMTQLNWGGYRYLTGSNRGFFRATPEAIANIESRSATDRVMGSVQFRHRPWSWLSQRLTAGSDVGDEVSSVLFPSDPAGSLGPFGLLSEGDKTVDRRRVALSSFDYVASVSPALGTLVTSTTSAGAQYYTNRVETMQAYGHGFPVGVAVVGGAAVTSSSEDVVENKGVGVFAQQQFGWKNRRFLTGALRVDDHSAFGANFNVVTYPKVSASWVLNEESFWGLRFVDALKLRAAWGLAGRQPDAFAAERTYQPVSGPGGTPILTPQNVGNPDLKPERGQELEVGFDAGLWQGRVATAFTWFRQVTRDAIVPRVAAPSGGFSGTQLANLGEVLNRGFEFSLDARILNFRSLGWELGGSFSTNENRIVSLGGLEPIQLAQAGVALSASQFHVEGYPLAAYFLPLVVSASIDGSGNAINIMCASGPEAGALPVPCDDSARQRLFAGRPSPSWEGNVRTSLTLLRNLRLHTLVDIRGGHMMWYQTGTAAHRQEGNTRAMNERTDPILLAYDALAIQSVLGTNVRQGIMKGDFAKLREVSLTYTLPMTWAARIGASSATLTVAGRNLAILWVAQKDVYGFKSLDPETHSASDLGANSNNLMPPFTSAVAALRITF